MKTLSVTILGVLFPVIMLAQSFSSFNNRNHPELRWQVAETAHFKIMYPRRLAGIETKAAPVAEASYKALAANLDVQFNEKIRIYLSDEDEISNGFATPRAGGFTDIWVQANDYAETWTGEVKWLRKVIAHELAHIFHYKAVKSNLGLLQYVISDPVPSFWTEGLAQYETEKWDAQRGDRYLRLAVFDDRLSYSDGSSMDNGRLKYAVGNSQVRYFTDTYGDSTLAKLFKQREGFLGLKYHNFSKSFSSVTGRSYQFFYDEWRKHVNVYYNTLASQMQRTDSLGIDPTPLPGNFYFDVRYSPDQEQIAVLSLPSIKRPLKRLYVMQNDSTKKLDLLAEGGINTDLNWSPDGQHLAYSRRNRGDHSSLVNDIYIYDLGTSNERRLTHSRKAVYPAFGPDGKELVYIVNEGRSANIFRRNLATGTEKRMTSYSGDVQLLYLKWNHQRNELVFYRLDADGQRNLIRYNLETADEHIIDHIGDFDNRKPVLSPDGQKLAYTSLRDEVPNVFVYDFKTDTARRYTHQFIGAEVFDWISATGITSGQKLVLKASESRSKDQVYLVNADRKIAIDSIAIPDAYAHWRQKSPVNIIPYSIGADSLLIQKRYKYSALANLKHLVSFALPYYAGPADYGVFGATTWGEPLNKHGIQGGGNISLKNPSEHSYGFLNYTNNQLYPSLRLAGYKMPVRGQAYNGKLLIDEMIGGELSAIWPVDWFSESYRKDKFGIRLRHVLIKPRDLGDVKGPGFILPDAQSARQTDLQLTWITKKQRPYVNNQIHPIDGYGIKFQLTAAEKIVGSELSFLTSDLSGYKIIPALGLQRIYLYGRFQARRGRALPQNYLGFSQYETYSVPLPEDYLFSPLNTVNRVRGFRNFVTGKQVAFGTIEYLMPFFPSLQTSILSGFVRLGQTSVALFADGGMVWNVQTPRGDDIDMRLGAGIELKNKLGLGPFTFIHSLGIAQPHDKLFSDDSYDLYYRVKATLPF